MIIVFASRKGGSGKSTNCCNMAGHLAQQGNRVGLLDTDPQATSMNWANARADLESVPPISAFPAKGGKQLLRTINQLKPSFDFLLLDLQGVDSEENRFVLTLADKIIFPFKPSQPDLDTLEWVRDMRDQLREVNPTCSAYYVINEAPTTTNKEKDDTRLYFESLGVKPIKTVIHSRKSYRDSMSLGLSVVEMHDQKAKDEIENLVKEVMKPESLSIVPVSDVRAPSESRLSSL